jgi:predicted ester cyclase
MTHFHVVDGKIRDEWAVWDELALLTQIKIGEMTK